MSNYNYTKETFGKCPRCNSNIYEGGKSFYCSNPDCGFTLWKESFYLKRMKKTINGDMARELLEKGQTYVDDLWSEKKQKTFAAYLNMTDDGERVNFSLSFPE
ncbi:MAG: hypothetical protein Q4C42_11920 [Clostridia bacterium]|nr:hypothetical protein [Clostridia bacterium]